MARQLCLVTGDPRPKSPNRIAEGRGFRIPCPIPAPRCPLDMSGLSTGSHVGSSSNRNNNSNNNNSNNNNSNHNNNNNNDHDGGGDDDDDRGDNCVGGGSGRGAMLRRSARGPDGGAIPGGGADRAGQAGGADRAGQAGGAGGAEAIQLVGRKGEPAYGQVRRTSAGSRVNFEGTRRG
ncbi:hypothetical protein ACRALDRAFT_1072746 [Sodiomyces alcalophilus JCM 7366]|uniref:uncharacterized protein n=1 Tax=Sodiomyces alcalophilus JCM 7366 TaxID=591952 RepID=UPI0039B66DCC